MGKRAAAAFSAAGAQCTQDVEAQRSPSVRSALSVRPLCVCPRLELARVRLVAVRFAQLGRLHAAREPAEEVV